METGNRKLAVVRIEKNPRSTSAPRWLVVEIRREL